MKKILEMRAHRGTKKALLFRIRRKMKSRFLLLFSKRDLKKKFRQWLGRKDKKQKFLELIAVPCYSIALGFGILYSAFVDILTRTRQSFRRGPVDELGSYAKEISTYAEQRFGIRLGRKKRRRSRSCEKPSARTEPVQ